jgi:hypothetical protein
VRWKLTARARVSADASSASGTPATLCSRRATIRNWGCILLLAGLLHVSPARTRERIQTGRVALISAFHGRIPSRVETPQMRGVIACLFASAGPAAGR